MNFSLLFLFTLFLVLPCSLLASKDRVFLEQICHEVASSMEYNSCMAFAQSVVSSNEPTNIGDAVMGAMNDLMDFIGQSIANVQDHLKLGNLTDQIRAGLESCSGNFENAKNDVQAAINDLSSGSFKDAIHDLGQVVDEAKSCDDNLAKVGLNVDRLKTGWRIGKIVAKIVVRIIWFAK